MTNIDVLENQISEAIKYLTILKRYLPYTQEKIENDIDLRGAVERYLYLVCQATIDLAESYIAYKKFRKPQALNDNFYILEEEKVINVLLREKMVAMTGFRNFIAHDYGKIDYGVVYGVLQNRLKDINTFIKLIENKLPR